MRAMTTTLSILMIGAAAVPLGAAAADPGQAIYLKACAACHNANGKGTLPGAPDFTKKGGVLSQADAVLMKHMVEGFKSPGSPMPMPPKAGNPSLTEAQLRAALEYAKREFAK